MKVYLAAPGELLDVARAYSDAFAEAGIDVTSRWLYEFANGQPLDVAARHDLEDVARADTVVLLNPSGFARLGTGGRHAEVGYALALGKPVAIFGIRSNVFHHVDAVSVYDMQWRPRDTVAAFMARNNGC